MIMHDHYMHVFWHTLGIRNQANKKDPMAYIRMSLCEYAQAGKKNHLERHSMPSSLWYYSACSSWRLYILIEYGLPLPVSACVLMQFCCLPCGWRFCTPATHEHCGHVTSVQPPFSTISYPVPLASQFGDQ